MTLTPHFLCHTDDIANNSAQGFIIKELSLVAVKQLDVMYVYHNRCPHLQLPLEWMPNQFLDYDKHYIQCASHGALFTIKTGECVSGPCLGDSLQSVDFCIENNRIMVNL